MASPSDPSHSPGWAGAVAGRTVLILEDEVFVAMELQMSLEDVGASVVQAFTVSEALQALEGRGVDAAVLDVNLGGRETCEPVAQALRDRRTPFLLYTGDLQATGELVSRIGAPIVSKPAGEREVVERLGATLTGG